MRTTALLYHDVVPQYRYESSGFQGADADIYKLECDTFRRHMERLSKETSLQAAAITAVDPASADRQLLLTFDDGGASATHVAEVLAPYGWPAHFFVTTGRIGTPGFLDAAGIRRLHSAGHVIGSHSYSHPLRMLALSPAQLLREWSSSVGTLQDILGHPVTTASIPGGYYSRAVASAAAQAGIRVLFTSEPVTRTAIVDGCLVVGRFSVQQGVSSDWVVAVASDRVRPRAGRFLAWNGKKMLKAAGGPVWLSVRKSVLSWQAGAERRRVAHR